LYNPIFYKDNSNQIFIFSIGYIGTSIKYNIKEIENDNIIPISEEILASDSQKFVGREDICLNNDFVLSSMHTFFLFENNQWNPIYTNNDLKFASSLGGFSKNFMFCFLDWHNLTGTKNVGLIYENGNIHYERNLILNIPETPKIQRVLNDRIIFIPTISDTRLFIGTKKYSQ